MNTGSQTNMRKVERKHSDNPSLIRRLLLGLTLTVALIMGIFLLWDYHSGRRTMIYQQRIGLREQAQIILRTLAALEDPGQSEIQQYIDSACQAMDETTSPGHHIIVTIGERVLQARAHHHHTFEDWESIKAGARSEDGITAYGDKDIVAAESSKGDKAVYVSKNLDVVYEAMRDQVRARFLSILLVTLIIIMVTRMAVHRMLERPLSDTINMMKDFVAGRRDLHMPDSYPKELEVVTRAFERMAGDVKRLEKEQSLCSEEISGILDHLRSDINDIPGFEVKAFAGPAAGVSGDFFDVLPLQSGKTLFCMGDAGSRNTSSAVKAAILSVTLAHIAADHTRPHELMKRLNDTLFRIDPEGTQASLLIALWDTEERQISYASAVHETCYLLKPDGKESGVVNLEATGVALGNRDSASWTTASVDTGENDMLVLLTDGFAATWSEGGEQFGRERLRTLLAENINDRPGAILQKLQTAVAEHRGENPRLNDAAVLAAKEG